MKQRVYVDTNIIIAAHAHSFWKAMATRYALETVSECERETHTGCQNRSPETRIDDREFRSSLARPPHDVDDLQRARVLLMDGGPALDAGERDLWAHALDDEEAWMLSGPDTASTKFGLDHGYGERLVSLEDLVVDKKDFARKKVAGHYHRKWLDNLKAIQSFARLGKA